MAEPTSGCLTARRPFALSAGAFALVALAGAALRYAAPSAAVQQGAVAAVNALFLMLGAFLFRSYRMKALSWQRFALALVLMAVGSWLFASRACPAYRVHDTDTCPCPGCERVRALGEEVEL